LFLDHLRENLYRADVSALEFGQLAQFALSSGRFASQHRLASEMGRSVSQVCEGIQLAKLPDAVVAAFSSPDALQYRHAKALSDAVALAENVVVAEANLIQAQGAGLAANEVVRRLTTAAGVAVRRSNSNAGMPLECNGIVFGSLQFDKSDCAVLKLNRPLDDKQRAAFKAHVVSFYRRKVLRPEQ